LVWVKRAGGTVLVAGFDVSVAADGSPLVAGVFKGKAVFGPGEPGESSLSAAGANDIFVARLLP
jgi:hypothetical protein